MIKRVLIIGGYGNFGRFIAQKLAAEHNIQLVIAGRNRQKALSFVRELKTHNPAEAATLDINDNLDETLSSIAPDIVIHTSGPFQGQDYHVAKACIKQGCHYIDLADARDFVAQISKLHEEATKNGVLVCSGASSVPCLTSALIDEHIGKFKTLESVDYAIATAHLTNRGLATTRATLSYAGKPFKTLIDGSMKNVYGWLGLRQRKFWGLNTRLLGHCDIPDLALFPKRYPSLKTIRFQASLGLKSAHLALWLLSLGVYLKIIPSLKPLAATLLKLSYLFDPFGKKDSGFYMSLKGTGQNGETQQIDFDLVAKKGDGLYIPVIPAILMTKKLANNTIQQTGAYPCIGFIDLAEYLENLKELKIDWQTTYQP